MRRLPAGIALVFAVMISSHQLRAGDTPRWSFVKIADSNTQLPQKDTDGVFESLGNEPGFSRGTVVFNRLGASDIYNGIYAATEGMLRVVADQTTISPSTSGPFMQFGAAPPSVSNGVIVFCANNPGGVYQRTGDGPINIVADSNTIIPGDPNFFGPPLNAFVSTSNGNIAFLGANDFFQTGVYAVTDGTPQAVALPGVENNSFRLQSFGGPVISTVNNETTIAFFALDANTGRFGIFLANDILTSIADTATTIPDGFGTFTGFGSPPYPGPAIHHGNIAFVGEGSGNQRGIYHTVGGLRRAADRTTVIPEGTGTFFTFENPSLVDNHVLFIGTGQNSQIGIYIQSTAPGSSPTKVIDASNTLDGKQIAELKIGRESLDDSGARRFAFWSRFTDNTEGIFVASELDCTIAADDEIQFDTAGHIATAIDGPGLYTWSITGGVIDIGQGTNEITFTAGSDEELILELTIEDNGVLVECQKNVAIRFGPTATASNTGPVCDGENVTLLGGPDEGVIYAWTGPDGYSSNEQSPIISPAIAGEYTLTATDDNDLFDVATTIVIVNDNPVATANNDGPVCDGFDIGLTGGPDGIADYDWTGPGGFTSDQQHPTVSPASAGTYVLTVTNDNGCQGMSETIVAVFDNPVATAGNNGPACFGNDADLFGGPDGLTSYQWNGPDGFTSTEQNPTVSPAIAGFYELTVTDHNNCQDVANTELVVEEADVSPPNIICPGNAARNCGDSTSSAATGSATATDNCGGTITITFDDAIDGSCPQVITRTWSATDEDENESTCDQIITLAELPTPPLNNGGGTGGGGNVPPPVDMLSGSGITDENGEFSASAILASGQALAEVEIINATPGETVSYAISNIVPNANGLLSGPIADRIFTVESSAAEGSFVVVISIFLTIDEIGNIEPDTLRLVVLDESIEPNAWRPIGENVGSSSPTTTVGDSGNEQITGFIRYWTVRDRLSTFAIGELLVEPADTEPDTPTDDSDLPSDDNMQPTEPPVEQTMPSDSDGDSVNDDLDLCIDTPIGTMVDDVGCPIEAEPDISEPTMPTDCGAAPCGTIGMLGLVLLMLGFVPIRALRRKL